MTESDVATPEVALATYVALQPRLFAIAYRMLGSVSDADDVVQDVWLRWERAAPSARSAEAMLVTICTRLSLDRMRAVQRRREEHVGPWLPEPLLADPTAPDPADVSVLTESMGIAFLRLLDRLTERERAVLVLHDVFGYIHGDIATMIDETPANCRQLLARARRKLGSDEPAVNRQTVRPSLDARRELVFRFVNAASAGDIAAVLSLCAPDITLVSDGGPTRRAARHEIVTPDRVSRFFTTIAQRIGRRTGGMEVAMCNGDPAIVFRHDDGTVDYVVGFSGDGQSLRLVWLVLDPEKVRHLDGPNRTWRCATN